MKNLKKIGFWFKANKLSRNSKKTKCILFHIKSSKDDQPLKLLALKISDNTVERKRAIKLLGVMSDENIFWDEHIRTVETIVPRKAFT